MNSETLENEYLIKTPEFEGPLSLLLSLIEKRKLFINDFSLAQVTEDYLDYINKNNSNMAIIANFIVIASMLILIKSKSLLPDLNLTEEEKSDIIDLQNRLILYEKFNKLSENIKKRFGKRIIFAPQKSPFYNKNIFLPDKKINLNNLRDLIKNILENTKTEELQIAAIKKTISLEEIIEKLKTRVQESLNSSIYFSDFIRKANTTNTQEEKIFIIVSFLALLELVRQGIFNASQENYTDNIIIHL